MRMMLGGRCRGRLVEVRKEGKDIKIPYKPEGTRIISVRTHAHGHNA